MMRIRGRAWCVALLMGQPVAPALAGTSYDDVAVIVNVASQASGTIGAHFAAQRGIPAANIIYVNVSTNEEIDDLEFQSLRNQIESHLQAHSLVDAVNYLVTTKGVPLKINRGDTSTLGSPSASVESDLMCVLGPNAANVGSAGRTYSPYWSRSAHFSRAAYGIYLVTRLDGYTTQDVLDLIDRSGPDTRCGATSPYVFDQDPAWDATAAYLNDYLAQARTLLQARGKTVELNDNDMFVTARPSVAGYVSWGSNDHRADDYTQFGIPRNTWAPGALAETYVSTSGRSFDDPPAYGQSLIADLIREGVSGAKGYVYEPFATAMANPSILFDRYTSGYNLAESYFMASRYISWMDVVIGDPKTSIVAAPDLLPVQLASFTVSFDASASQAVFSWGTLSEVNNFGFYVQIAETATPVFTDIPGGFIQGHGTTLVPQQYTWSTANIPNGSWFVRLRQVDMDGSEYLSDSRVLTVGSGLAGVDADGTPAGFHLAQNYPNPFNPATTIRYTLPAAARVRLVVYDAIGEEVATLVDGTRTAGNHEAVFATRGESTGTYYYRLSAGQQTETRTMLLVK